MERQVWDGYADWSEVSNSGNLKMIRKRITGRTNREFQANVLHPELLGAIEDIRRSVTAHHGDAARVLDFGCGLGRNGASLRGNFGRNIGLDLPGMIVELRKLPAALPYDALYDDLAALVVAEDVDVCFDSVVFQHIVDRDFCQSVIDRLILMPRLRYVISLCNVSVARGWASIPLMLAKSGWEEIQKFEDLESFSRPHTYRVLRKI